MSFPEQERALFDLLFDRDVRDRFCEDRYAALANYDLEKDEKADFSVLRVDALEVDANIRVNLVMSQLCRSYPISFSIMSSVNGGIELLKSLVDVTTMRAPYVDRPVIFGKRLGEKLSQPAFHSNAEKQLLSVIFQLELGMAWTASSLKHVVIENGEQTYSTMSSLPDDWADRPVRLAEYVTAGLVPLSYKKIKRRLCPVSDNELWRFLTRTPTSVATLSSLLSKQDPRLLISRAKIEHMSLCEPTVTYQTTELSEGFAPLFQYINGSVSVNALLGNLKEAGADGNLLNSVKSGFEQLLLNGMLLIL